MTYYVEVRPTVRRTGKIKLVRLEEVHKHTGFRSVYGYSAELANTIQTYGSTASLRGQSVYSDTLFVDFDTDDCGSFRQELINQSLAYEEFETGNRGVHFHIPIEPIEGVWVPHAQKTWVKNLAPQADISFYHPAGVYRLPRTFHQKAPGKFKRLIERRDGNKLCISEPAPEMLPIFDLSTTKTEQDVYMLMLEKQQAGNRQPHVWRIATTAAEASLPFMDAVEKCLWWNEHNCNPPHQEGVIIRQCEKAYSRKLKEELWKSNGPNDIADSTALFATTQTS